MTQAVIDRIPRGVSTGGQFTGRHHTEPGVSLGSAAPEETGARAEAWNRRFSEVAAYVAEHGSMPAANPSQPKENRLASWLNDQRRSPVSEERARRLDEAVPGWRDPREARWQKRLAEVREFHEANGRLPAAGRESTLVSSYGRWLVYQRRNEARLPEHRIRALDALDPDWRNPNPSGWAQNVQKAAGLVERLGRFPVSGAKDPEEHRVAEWLSSQRTNRARMTREQLRELDSSLPGWDRGREQVWRDRLDWTAGFVARNGRFPSQHSASMVEASHAAWVRAQRRTAANLSDGRTAMLDARLPGWRGA